VFIESHIIDGCLQNDRRAQQMLYKQCYAYLLGVAKRYMGQEDEVMEVITESFLKILKHINSINDQPHPEAWIRRVAINTALDIIRSRKRYYSNIKLQNDESYNALENLYIETDTIDKSLDTKYIYNIIQNLPELTREVINLFAIDGFNHKEISEILRIKEELSRWHVFKARKLIAEKIKNYQEVNIQKYKK
jgi:RNA polymerase sigma factor (sigma-70 family)